VKAALLQLNIYIIVEFDRQSKVIMI